MAQYFPTATDHPYAEVMNKASKSVFSGTLKATDWANSTILSGDTTEEIEKLRREGTGEILAHGEVGFARSLVRLDLVDEDDDGLGWSTVGDARDPAQVRSGAMLVAGNRFGGAVVRVVASGRSRACLQTFE